MGYTININQPCMVGSNSFHHTLLFSGESQVCWDDVIDGFAVHELCQVHLRLNHVSHISIHISIHLAFT